MIARAKKWGNSLGLIVPAEVVHAEDIRDGDFLEVEIHRKLRRPDELSGTWKFRRNLPDLIREMKEGWDERQRAEHNGALRTHNRENEARPALH